MKEAVPLAFPKVLESLCWWIIRYDSLISTAYSKTLPDAPLPAIPSLKCTDDLVQFRLYRSPDYGFGEYDPGH